MVFYKPLDAFDVHLGCYNVSTAVQSEFIAKCIMRTCSVQSMVPVKRDADVASPEYQHLQE